MNASALSQAISLRQLQSEGMRLMFEAQKLKDSGNIVAARALYDLQIDVIKRQLAGALSLNTDFPSGIPLEIVPIVNPLLDALLIQSSLVEALGDQTEALRLRDEAIALAGQYLDETGLAERQRQLAGSLLSQGRFHEGLQSLACARDLFARQGMPVSAAEAGTDLANFYEWLGDHERALEEANHASAVIADRLPDGCYERISISGCFSAITDAQSQAGEEAAFSAALLKAQEDAQLLKTGLEIDQILARVGRHLGRIEESEQLFERVYPHIPPVAQPAILWQIAAIRLQQQRFGECLSMLTNLEPEFSTGRLRPKLSVLLRCKAEALLGLERAGEALPVIDKAIQQLSEFYDPDALWNLHWVRARILEALNRNDDALQSVLAAAAIVDELRRAPLGWRLDSTYLKDKLPMFQTGIRLATAVDNAPVCCRLIQQVKARALAAALHVPALPASRTFRNESAPARRVEELNVALDAVDYGAYMEGWTPERERQREALLRERSGLLEQLRIADPRWHALTSPVPLDLSQIQTLLAARQQAVLDLFFTPESITSVLITGHTATCGVVGLSPRVRTALDQYLAGFTSGRFDPRLADPSVALDLSAEDLLPDALLEAALGADSLLIIPHGVLHLLPWAGLRARGKRLFEHLPVSVLPNLTCLTALDGKFPDRPQAALLGAPDYAESGLVPLYGAQHEIEMIADIYQDAGGLLASPQLGRNATEAAFWELAAMPDAREAILHLACHASFASDEPQHSALQLTNGQLDASDIASSRLPFGEVILSGCNTGQRALKVKEIELAGDDIIGLPGAFLEAGVRAVLTSIPPASDSASLHFMTRYHDERACGMPPMKALHAVQTALLQEGIFPVESWIGFTLYGAQ